MDYSKVKFVTPSVDGEYFTNGKVYAFEFKGHKAGYVTDDGGEKISIFIPESAHLDYNPFIPCHEDGTPLNQSDNSALNKTSVNHSMSGDGMNSLEFFDMIKKEWCRSEEQYKSFWNDVLTFARKYHKERKEYGG